MDEREDAITVRRVAREDAAAVTACVCAASLPWEPVDIGKPGRSPP